MTNDGAILYSELIKKLNKKVVGRSLSFPKGWIYIEDIEEIIKLYKIGKIIKQHKEEK